MTDPTQLEAVAALREGMKDSEIPVLFGVKPATVREWARAHPHCLRSSCGAKLLDPLKACGLCSEEDEYRRQRKNAQSREWRARQKAVAA